MHPLFCLLLTTTTLLGASRAQVQQPPAAVADSAAVQAVPHALGTADVIVRTNGDELPARVLGVTPQVVRYLPPPDLPGWWWAARWPSVRRCTSA
ncbi:hypothetical protein D0N36_15305 [Hymenobacter lapidiphilus]|uniref:hypothetical protein n=1 Tax=Hymenobacter sp. CCM 8763 TaxID=2303334 RepID=UPI000E357CB5|nr:hypothetical protein [Hymenobacter sp. CCM 8763]RFP64183.1 hypothetical protein D0N36_15305 [Hymenobacter sp. CCM 8763]